MILLQILAGLLIVLVLLMFLSGNSHVFRGIKVVYLKGHLSAYIEDWENFDCRSIQADPQVSSDWETDASLNRIKPTGRLQRINKRLGTVAFLVIKNDRIWHESYADNYGKYSKTNSFSMAKSMTVALLGKAIEEGYIQGLEQKVSNFFAEVHPELTVGDLASMYSGMKWNENYDNPFSSVAKIYLKKDVRSFMLKQKYSKKPGGDFHYNSGNTLLLGMVIEKATGQKLSDYLSEKIWKPMGMQEDALWQLDSKSSGMEKSFCCIASNARDFARFGKLFMDGGKWNGKLLLDPEFVEKCIHPRTSENPQYGYGFWLSDYKNKSIFLMYGILGQYVICIPEDDLIIVRLGHERDIFKDSPYLTQDFYTYVDEVYKMLEAEEKYKFRKSVS